MGRRAGVLLSILAILATACSSTSSSPGGQSVAPATAPASSAGPAATGSTASAAACTGVQYVGTSGLIHPYVQQVQAAFEAEAKANNRTFQWLSPTQFDEAKQIELIETALGYTCLKGLAHFAFTTSLYKGVDGEAAKKGIPVLALVCNPPPINTPVCIEIDNTVAFKEVAKEIAKRLGGKGNVVVSTGTETTQDLKYQVMVEYWKANNPDIKVLGTIANCDDPLTTVGCAENALSRYPTMNAYASTGFNNAIGAAKTFPGAGRTDIVVQGVDDDPVVVQGIKDGSVAFTLLQSPTMQGRMFFDIPFWMAEEGLKPVTVGEYIDTPGFIIDKTSIDTYVADRVTRDDAFLAGVKTKYFTK
jgi:ribose transport system substrate-binding protein